MQTFNLYTSIDDSNSYCNLLIDLYRNRPDYDPFKDYFVCRTGQYEYILCYGDLDGEFTSLVYRGGQGVNYSLSVLNYSDGCHVNTQGYNYVGNVPGSSSSSQSDQYRVGFLVPLILFLIAVLSLYRLIRRRHNFNSHSGITI